MTTFARAVADAGRDGYPGLEIQVDMDWAAHLVPDLDRLFRFEAALNRLVLDQPLALVCAYHRRRFDHAAIQRACSAHPITPGLSELRARRLATPGLALSGQTDLANRDALAKLLDCLPDTDRTLDITGLDFIDAGGIGLIARAAAGSTHRTTVRCTPATARLLRLLAVDRVASVHTVR